MLYIYVTKPESNVKGVILPDLIRFKKDVVLFIKQKHAFVYPCVEEKQENGNIVVKKADATGHTGWLISETEIFTDDAKEDIVLTKDMVKKHKMANANDMNALSIAYCSVKE